MNRRTLLTALGASSLSTLAPAWAKDYPSGPIRMVVPYAAGGGIDAVARLLAQGMGEELGQSLVVDNRPGAGGTLGADVVAKALPDGHTVLLAGNSELTIGPWLQDKPSYSATHDFTPVVLVAQSPNVLVTQPSLGAKTLRTALDAGRRLRGGLSIATPGNGTPQHVAVELLRAQTGIDIVHVPYKGAAPATTAALAGEVTMALVGAPPVLPHISSGKLVALAVTQPQRSPLVAEVPTVAEAIGAMADDDIVTWYGLLVPSRTPAAAVQTLERAAFAVLRRPDTRARLAALGTDLMATPRAAFAERMQKESRRYAEIVKRFGIKAS